MKKTQPAMQLAWLEPAMAFVLEKTRLNLSILGTARFFDDGQRPDDGRLFDYAQRPEDGRLFDYAQRPVSFPEYTEGSSWRTVEGGGWVGGHWVGLLWLAYAQSRDPLWERAARAWAACLTPRATDETTHDLGFLFELSHQLGWQITQDDSLKAPALLAAKTLIQRFNPKGHFLQAWGHPKEASPELRGRTIVDTLMNLDLLFWASEQTGDPRYGEIAAEHAHTCLLRHVRPDGSSAHVCDFDPESGAFLRQETHQGLSATSCWSRGQSWAVYGFTDCYRALAEPAFLKASRHTAEYALRRLPPDGVPYWDYDSPLIPNDVRDSSAASILAAGLFNLAEVEEDREAIERWQKAAIEILHSLWMNYTDQGQAGGENQEPSILTHGTRSKPHGLMDHGLIYGDYYFMEALVKLWNLQN